MLRTAAQVAPDGVDCHISQRLASLPAFSPDHDRQQLHAEVAALRHAIHQADGIVFSTPEYAGALPGSLKNLLGWTIGDDHSESIAHKAVAWINASPRGAPGAHRELRTVLGYAHPRIIDSACAHVRVSTATVGLDGPDHDEKCRATLAGALAALGAPRPPR